MSSQQEQSKEESKEALIPSEQSKRKMDSKDQEKDSKEMMKEQEKDSQEVVTTRN